MYLLFDFDGTICDSLDASLHIANKYLSLVHLPHLTKSQIESEGFISVIDHYHIPKPLLVFFVYLGRWELSRHLLTLSVVPELATTLHTLSKHHTLGILSSNSSANISQYLAHHHLLHIFSQIHQSARYFGKSKLLRLIKPSFYVTDETRDVVAAHEAHCKSIAVSWGFESAQLLHSSHPTHLISSPAQLLHF